MQNEVIKTRKQLLLEVKKEQQLADLFNKCMHLMNESRRKILTISVTH